MRSLTAVEIRTFVPADCSLALEFWQGIEGLGLNESDTPEAVQAFLQRNPGFSAIAVAPGGQIVGAVLCGHNGRSGSLYHLAVASSHRGLGIGRRLVEYCFAKLAAARIPRCNIFAYTENEAGNGFWLRNGWNDPTTWKVLQKRVQQD
jgi:putative acetyltransferase